MATLMEKQTGKLLGLLAEDGKEYGSLVAERLVKLVRSESLESRDTLHRQLVVGAAPYLSHTAWYARVAAASCLESLARLECVGPEMTVCNPSSSQPLLESTKSESLVTTEGKLARGWVSLGDLRLKQVLQRGVLLLSRGSQQDEAVLSEQRASSLDVDTRVGQQRKRLLKCLGLAGGKSGDARAASFYSSLGDMIDDEDLEEPLREPPCSSKTKTTAAVSNSESRTGAKDASKRHGNSSGDPASPGDTLSARQRNQLARKKRSAEGGGGGGGSTSGGGCKRRQQRTTEADSSVCGDNGDERGRGTSGLGGWGDHEAAEFLGPGGGMIEVATDAREALVSLAADLVTQLFHPKWQCRHGAALGALSILRAWNARRRRGESVPYGDRMEAWAEDAVARCVCVLGLDQFGDYSGRMVAPVRETAAQLLAVAALQLPPARLRQAATLLCELTIAEEWQARHGGFCGLESLCAVAIRGDQGEGASKEYSAFLQGLVFSVVPSGLRDQEEDVCAAAARAARLVTKRFLPLSWRMPTNGEARRGTSPASSAGSGNRGSSGGSDTAGSRDSGGNARRENKQEEEEEVFDLVWKALGALHKHSACVEDVAELLETCCEDAASRRRRGGGRAFDPITGQGESRLQRLLELWGDGRARVRACAVRSLSALAGGIIVADGSHYAAAAPTAPGSSGMASTMSMIDRCGGLLRRCFRGILFESDDNVRAHTAQLWKRLLPELQKIDNPSATYAALAKACLEHLFDTDPTAAAPTDDPPTGPQPRPSSSTAHPSVSLTPQSPTTTAEKAKASTARSSRTPPVAAATAAMTPPPPRKRARSGPGRSNRDSALAPPAPGLPAGGGTNDCGDMGAMVEADDWHHSGGSNSICRSADAYSDMDVAATGDRHEDRVAGGGAALAARPGAQAGTKVVRGETEEPPPGNAEDSVSDTKFSARVAAARALAELVRVAISLSTPSSPRTGDSGKTSLKRAGADDVDDVVGRPESSGNESSVGLKCPPGSSLTVTSCVKGVEEAVGAREIVLWEAIRRAESKWAWEREMAFLLLEACGGNTDVDNGDPGGISEDGDGYSEAEQAAREAVDRALSGTEGADIRDGSGDGNGGGNVFRELESVDEAMRAACRGVMYFMLQESTHKSTSHAYEGENTSGTSRARTRGGTKQAQTRGSGSSPPASDASVAFPLPALSSGLERAFRILAAAFGETIIPLDRDAHPEEKTSVWTGRIAHFQGRMQEQQRVLATRTAAAAASAYVATRPLPKKLNPVLRPLMSAVKVEPDAERRAVSTARLACLAATLLSDNDRRGAGNKVLTNLAVLAKPQPRSSVEEERDKGLGSSGRAGDDGPAEALRHAIQLAATTGRAAANTVAASSGTCEVRNEARVVSGAVATEVGKHAGTRTVAYFSDIGDWVRQALAPLLVLAAPTRPADRDEAGGDANEKDQKGSATGEPSPPLLASGLNVSGIHTVPTIPTAAVVAEVTPRGSRDLWAALAVANALVQASRHSVSAATAAAAAAGGNSPSMSLLSAFLLETPMASGLLALSRRPVTHSVTAAATSTADGDNIADSGGVGGDSSSLIDLSSDAAVAVIKEAAGLCPEGVWAGLRADVLPALTGSCSFIVPSNAIVDMMDAGSGDHDVARNSVLRKQEWELRWGGRMLREMVDGMGVGVVPFAARLLPVALKGMTHADDEVRSLLAGTFNRLVKAVALASAEGGDENGNSGGSRSERLARRDKEVRCEGGGGGGGAGVLTDEDGVENDGELIARHLVRGEPLTRLDRGALPPGLAQQVARGVELRPYQWEGVAWLDFLRRIGAHGILADDMGLGKTLQALMAVAMCHHSHARQPGRRSLVICPAILVNHWEAECSRFFGDDLLRPVAYAGSASKRKQLAKHLGLTNTAPSPPSAEVTPKKKAEGDGAGTADFANVIITSYSVLRSDAEILGEQAWLYLVLDEAHLLRNPNTNVAKAARALKSSHRVGLTGTPIQNSVLELWSLFEFLMPGYLGDRRSFQRDVARPVRLALSSEGDGRATVEGLQELEHLHRQVLPFVLRREKIEVLADLPPKIITEIMCNLTATQRRLHKIWERGGAGGNVLAAVAEVEAAQTAAERLRENAAAAAAKTTSAGTAPEPSAKDGAGPISDVGIATAAQRSRLSVGAQTLACLSRLQLLCVHPALVLAEESDKRRAASKNLHLSGKLMALRELLWDAGIGERHGAEKTPSKIDAVDDESDDDDSDGSHEAEEHGQEDEEEESDADGDDDAKAIALEDDNLIMLDVPELADREVLDPGNCETANASSSSNSNTSLDQNKITSRDGREENAGGCRKSSMRKRGSTAAEAAENRGNKSKGKAGGAAAKGEPLSRSRPSGDSGRDTSTVTRMPGCKCLIFAQHKAALDVTESALLRPFFPDVSCLRVDGSVSQDERAAAVDRFSTDPAVGLLLLTTRVGHLGLNLHAASMVVFLEHDWNPQVDLQAMDRAHRLGQRKAVNVYRLIAADSIEQRVLRLQGHKLGVAAAVVGEENATAFARGTGEVLGMLGQAAGVVAKVVENGGESNDVADDVGNEVWSADEDYAYLAAEHLADSVARDSS